MYVLLIYSGGMVVGDRSGSIVLALSASSHRVNRDRATHAYILRLDLDSISDCQRYLKSLLPHMNLR